MHKRESAWDWGVKDCTTKYIWDWKWLIKVTPLKAEQALLLWGVRIRTERKRLSAVWAGDGAAGPRWHCRTWRCWGISQVTSGYSLLWLCELSTCLVRSHLGTLDLCCKMGEKGLSISLCSSFSCAEGNNKATYYCPVWPGFPNIYRNYLLDKEF